MIYFGFETNEDDSWVPQDQQEVFHNQEDTLVKLEENIAKSINSWFEWWISQF